jgi:hypothetical protein
MHNQQIISHFVERFEPTTLSSLIVSQFPARVSSACNKGINEQRGTTNKSILREPTASSSSRLRAPTRWAGLAAERASHILSSICRLGRESFIFGGPLPRAQHGATLLIKQEIAGFKTLAAHRIQPSRSLPPRSLPTSAEGAPGRPSSTCPSGCAEVVQGSQTAHSSSFQPGTTRSGYCSDRIYIWF